MTAPCPVCRQPAAPPASNPTAPFCSDRCRWIDLSAWLDQRYAIPGEPVTDDGAPADEEPDDVPPQR